MIGGIVPPLARIMRRFTGGISLSDAHSVVS